MSLLLLKLPMIFCPRRLAPKLIFAGARCFRNSALSAGPGTKTTFKTRLGPQDSNSPPVISQHTEKTPPIVRPGTYVKSVKYNREEEEGKVELHNPYQGIPTAWQVAYEHPFPPLRPTCPPPRIVEQLLTSRTVQLGEPIDQFLARCVPSQTEALAGPWIWIANPRAKHQPDQNFDPVEDLLREPLARAQEDWARIIADSSLNRVWLPCYSPSTEKKLLLFVLQCTDAE